MSGTPLLAMRWAEPVPARRARRHLDRDKRYEPGELAMTESTMFVEETQRQIEALRRRTWLDLHSLQFLATIQEVVVNAEV